MKITGNYQLSFGALVPKSQYSGTPKLSKEAIREIKLYREAIKKTEKDIIDIENNINNPDNDHGLVINYLKRKLDLLNSHRDDYVELINVTKKTGYTDHKTPFRVQKDHENDMKELNEHFLTECPEGKYVVDAWG